MKKRKNEEGAMQKMHGKIPEIRGSCPVSGMKAGKGIFRSS